MRDKIGPTGDFPDGKIGVDDDGGLRIGIAIRKDKILIAFGVSIDWIAMSPEDALEFASKIMLHAKELILKKESGGNG